MIRNLDIGDALSALRPNCEYMLDGENYSGITWLDKNQTLPTEQEVLEKLAELQAAEPTRQVRVIRDRLLAESDWTQNRDVVLLNDTTWQQYRQDLRDLPASASFTPSLDSNGDLDMSSVTWPLKPS